jgi:hypothetical protein
VSEDNIRAALLHNHSLTPLVIDAGQLYQDCSLTRSFKLPRAVGISALRSRLNE